MQQAWEQHQFHRSVQAELVWAKEAETLLSTEDIGKDLQGVRFLLKNHQVKKMCLRTHIHTYTHTYMHTHTHTYIHTYTHTYIT